MTVQHIFSMSLRIIANLDILILQKDLIQSYAENIEFWENEKSKGAS